MSERSLGADAAVAIAADVIAHAADRSLTVTVAVAGAGGGLLVLRRMDGCARLAVVTVQRKIASVLLTGSSTADTAALLAGELVAEPLLAPSMLASGLFAVPGGVPVRQAGSVVGVVAVSGASSQADDQLARLGASGAARP